MTAQTTLELAREIENAEPTDTQVDLARRLIDGSTTTSHALRAIQAILREMGDWEADEILERSGLFQALAIHEAETM